MIPLVQQKNGEILFDESLQQLMNNCIADLISTNGTDWNHISKDLRVRLQADSSGNWELKLLADSDSRPFKTVPSLQ